MSYGALAFEIYLENWLRPCNRTCRWHRAHIHAIMLHRIAKNQAFDVDDFMAKEPWVHLFATRAALQNNYIRALKRARGP